MAGNRDRKGLGRGLSALMADMQSPAAAESSDRVVPRGEMSLPIERVRPNPDQPRRAFSDDALAELAASISEKGVIQPLIVRPDPEQADMYQIVAGERRWRAAQRAQIHEVPVIVRDFNDTEVLEVAIIENIQRMDLNPVEEAQGYRQLMDRFGHTQEQLASAMGKSRSHIANLMRLLSLPDEILDMLRDGALSAGHARALVTVDDPIGIARRVVQGGLSVRDVERLAKKGKESPSSRPSRPTPEKDADTRALESDLSAALSLKVAIEHDSEKQAGKIILNYNSLDEMDDIIQLLNRGRG